MKIKYSVDGVEKEMERFDYFRPDRSFAALSVLCTFSGALQRLEPFWDKLEKKGACDYFGKKLKLLSVEVSEKEERENRNKLARYSNRMVTA